MQTDHFEIRPVTPDELAAVLDVYRQCEDFLALGPEPTASMRMVLQDIEISRSEGGRFCAIFAAGGEMIGIVDYVASGFDGDPRSAFLSLLMIAAPFRGRGIGQAVVERVEDEVRKDTQVTAILSAVQVNNPHALDFWQANGYARMSGPELQPDGTTTFRLRKDLHASCRKS